MDYSVLYVQANEKLGRTIKEYLTDEELEVLVAPNAMETLGILKERKISIILIDSFVPDMRHRDFIDRLSNEYPNVILNICMDVSDPVAVARISQRKNVWKIHIPPFSIEKMVEGILASVDRLCIDEDFQDRQSSFEQEEEVFEKTLVSLKETLVKQQYSYNVIGPFFNALLAGFAIKSEAGKNAKEFLCAAAQKMLLLQTATNIKCANAGRVISDSVNEISLKGRKIAVTSVDSCLMGDAPKKILADIVFSIWACCYYESMLSGELKVKIDSRYLSSTKCEFSLSVDGNPGDGGPESDDLLSSIILAVSSDFEIKRLGNERVFVFVFEVEGI